MPKPFSPERFLIVGLGSIGRRHLDCLRRLAPAAQVTVLRRPEHPAEDGIRVVHSVEDALAENPQAAIIANPAPYHIETGLALSQAGVHLLIEKPLSDRVEGVEKLLAACREQNIVLQVGYCLRFEPSLLALRQALSERRIGRVLHLKAEVGSYLPDWRPGTDYRDNVSARAELGGGVLLELSHEIDYLCWLAGAVRTVTATMGGSGELEMDAEDHADLLLAFENGVSGTLHMDMLQRPPVRTCKAVGTTGTLLWDGIARETRLYRVRDGEGTWQVLHAGEPGEDRDTMYMAQLRHFLDCIRQGLTPRVAGEDGLRVLKVIEAARLSAGEGRAVEP